MNPHTRVMGRVDCRACLLGFLVAACGLVSAYGQEAGTHRSRARIRSVSVGLGGWLRVGKWSPVQVRIAAGSRDEELFVSFRTTDPAERTVAYHSRHHVVSAGSTAEIDGHFQPGRLGGSLIVSLHAVGPRGNEPMAIDERRVVLETLPAVPFTWRMRVDGQDVSSGVDRIDVPVRAGTRLVFRNADSLRAHGLDWGDQLPSMLRRIAGSPGRLVDPRSPAGGGGGSREGGVQHGASESEPLVAQYEVVESLQAPVAFHGLTSGWALSGRLVPATGGDAGQAVREVELLFESQAVILSQRDKLWMNWGQGGGMDTCQSDRIADEPPETSRRAVAWPTGSGHRLVRREDLDAFDAVVLSGVGSLETSVAESEILSDWVFAGGHLVVAVGADLDAWQATPLSRWVPIRLSGQRQINDSDLRGLESLAVGSGRIPFLGRVTGTVLEVDAGQTRGEALSGPLIGEESYGLGRVTFLAVDIDRPPLTNWTDLPSLLDQLVEGREDEVASSGRETVRDSPTRRGALAYSGITDLKTQLQGLQEDFPGVSRPGIWQVLMLLLVVLLLVGPLDFLLVRHLLRYPQATWITLPLMLVTVTGAALWSGVPLNGHRLHVNQLEILDFDGVSGRGVSRSWATVYSPESRRYDVNWTRDGVAPNSDDSGLVGWSGVPEETFGGMHREGRRQVRDVDYEVDLARMRITGLPVAVWSTRSLHASWPVQDASVIESQLTSRGVGQLSGLVSHLLPGEIEDWLLAYGNRIYMPQAVKESGERWDKNHPLDLGGPGILAESLSRYLTDTTTRRVVRNQGYGTKVVASQGEYNPLGRDPFAWIEMLTWHRAAGGTGFTGLENRDLSAMDLSHLLPLGRAVLVGRYVDGSDPETVRSHYDLLIDGEPLPADRMRRRTYVRMVLPVAVSHRKPTRTFVDPDEPRDK